MDQIISVLRILQVAFGIGLVIFVHEAGHYLAARLCRVRVDVFSLGFGPRLFGWRRGATLYQVALVPFGGYVKMAGEDVGVNEPDRPLRADDLASKSPLQRFFIYSGGVVMNVVFALVALPLALLAGVPSLAPVIGEPLEGSPAWHARLEPGTLFHSVNGSPLYDFGDIPYEIALGGAAPVTIECTRAGSSTREFLTLQPEYSTEEGLYRIGVGPGWDALGRLIVAPGSAAAEAGLVSGDRLLGVAGQPASLQPQVQLLEAIQSEGPVTLIVADGAGQREVRVVPRTDATIERVLLGLQGGSLVIRDLRRGGLAESAGIAPGDRLLRIGALEPLTRAQVLPALIALTAGGGLEVERAGRRLEIPLPAMNEAQAIALAADLAIVADVQSTRIAVIPGSPASEAGLQDGDRLVAFDGEPIPSYDSFLDQTKPAREAGRAVTLEIERAAQGSLPERLSFRLTPRAMPPADYGLGLEPARYVWRVPSVPGAIAAGFASSVRFARIVWLTLRKMGSGEVSSKNMGGIIAIGLTSHSVALEGWAKLFLFLCILSINLAFINVLPIPVLDGGHLFFILIEMIKGSPVSRNTLGYSQIVGLVLIVSLMVYVTYNDVMRLLHF